MYEEVLHPDGRFLMIRRSVSTSSDADLIMVENWLEELKASARNGKDD